MKLTLTTVYEGFDQEWWHWYLKRLETSGIPDQERIAKNFRTGKIDSISFTTTHEGVQATTSYKFAPGYPPVGEKK